MLKTIKKFIKYVKTWIANSLVQELSYSSDLLSHNPSPNYGIYLIWEIVSPII